VANQVWIGNAAQVAQVDQLTVGGTPATGLTYTVALGFGTGKVVTYTAVSTDTTTTVATALQQALSSSLYPEFKEVVWSNPAAGKVNGTAQTAGVPFTLTAGGTGTLTRTALTPSSGPNDALMPANWSTGTLPASGDSIYFQATTISVLFNLQALAAITPAYIGSDASYTGRIGLPVNNANGYREYRPRFLQFAGATAVAIGQGSGQGSGKIQLDFQAGTYALSQWLAAGSVEPGMPAVQIKGGSASSSINIYKGTLGLALLAGETATVPTLNIDYVTNQRSDAVVTAGAGATLTNVKMSGGQLTALCAVPNLTSNGGTTTIETGSMTTATLNYAGSQAPPSTLNFIPAAAQTITTLVLGNNAVLDCSGTLQTVTITNSTLYAGCTINAPSGNVAMTNAGSIPDGQAADVTLNLGVGRTVKVA
jgi:hypothetical protein